MQAVVYEEFGGPEVLQTLEIDEPHAGPGEVRIAVRAAGVNPMDYKLRRGWFNAEAAVFPVVPGFEVAGVVDEVGDGVTEFVVGDEVVGWGKTGTFAEYALAGVVAKKPAEVSFEEAVALPVAGETSARALGLLGVTAGETVLIHGAAGGVGAVGVQLALALGATVIGTAAEANHDYLRSLGAIPVTYGEGLVDRVRAVAPQGIDAVYDVAGKGALPDSIELRGGTDRIVTIADPTAADHGIAFSAGGTPPEVQAAGLREQLELAATGKLKLKIAETFPFTDAAKAAEISESGHAKGKLVVKP
ncbi:NADPH:quinone reductase-like Zn-dependent oxidoreductase [Kribbella voronezhensis]|uniref:NADPH:quinone reductase-like Zn-dependent oxidoreductase n=1 Tax=Kribbella voronezhensis TaxID=2512212 RepID=A0A4V3FKS7_9ACTN|nr:NADP-dependent oxidoreductase [Kribbella voronezhensis]TDU91313.1 NADPH:quinone reductase-like Zn-dependent oxidoreductase [Kribbella voronezhensis]